MTHVLQIPCRCGEELTVRVEFTRYLPSTRISPEEPVVCGVEMLQWPCGHAQNYEEMVDSAYEVLALGLPDEGDVAYDNYIDHPEQFQDYLQY